MEGAEENREDLGTFEACALEEEDTHFNSKYEDIKKTMADIRASIGNQDDEPTKKEAPNDPRNFQERSMNITELMIKARKSFIIHDAIEAEKTLLPRKDGRKPNTRFDKAKAGKTDKETQTDHVVEEKHTQTNDDEDDFVRQLAACMYPEHDDAVDLLSWDRIDSAKEKAREDLKITIDSGAAISVMPPTCLSHVGCNDGPSGGKYRAANGTVLQDLGGKKVTFENEDGSTAAMNFRIASVTKPLASVSGIVKRNNKVVFAPGDSFIENLDTGRKVQLVEEKGAYVLTIPRNRVTGEKTKTDEGFARQGA